ncbi:MAG: phage tail tube protein [Candidatus Bathyarchaeota archaeon]|nr:phage tail tube protein [Candidatus Bathyarchaeota archaeon]
MAFITGIGTQVHMGKESSFGLAVTPTDLIDITSESIKVSVEKGDEGSLLGSKTATHRDLLSVTVVGSLSFILRPESAGLLFHAALGGSDLCEQVDELSEFYTHTFALCDVNESLPSLTVLIDRKAAVKRYPGCSISSLSLECAAGDYVKGSIDIKGTTEESGSLNPSLSGFSLRSYRCSAASFSLGGQSFDITRATLKVDNALESAPKTYSSGLYAGQPQHGKRDVTISFELPYSAEIEALKSTYLTAEESAAVSLSFSSPTPGHEITITLPSVSIGEVDATVSGTGILSSTVSGQALSSGTDEPITVVITDLTSTAYGE